MFAWKKKSNTLLAFFALIILSSVSVLAETAYFYWYDVGGTLCTTTNAGALIEGGVTTNTGSAPTSNPACCDVEGSLTVDYYTDYGEWYSAKYNGGIRVQAYTINWDANLRDCTCYGKSWSIGGDIEACCGDDANEYKLTRNCASWCSSSTSDDACCSSSDKCVYNSVCYSPGSCYSNNAYCNSGTWYDSDSNPSYCTSCVGIGHWSVGGEVAATTCCGDDSGEFYVTQGVGQPACCSQGTPNICVSSSKKCRNEWDKETSCHDGLDNDCSGETDCEDADCQTGTETNIVNEIDIGCRDGIDNNCNGLTDCSDPGCSLSLDCIGCEPETGETTCSDGEDNDCDDYIDCVDSDCIGTEVCLCELTSEICDDTKDNDCDGKIDCEDVDCFEPCGGCVAENTESLCKDGLDNDCDGFIDNLDNDCPGCKINTKLCVDGSCKEVCDPQGCIGEPNGNCEEGEGCACEDCFGKRDSCERELICNPNTGTCSCPSGTTMCSDGKCRTKCFVCGNGLLEEGEECDGGTNTCNEFDDCTGSGIVTCTDDCTWNTNECTCPQCDPTKIDNYCCVIPGDGKCDPECTANADPDCTGCTPYMGDCCEDKKDDICDFDCISYKDPDCSTSCSNEKDNCCNANSDGVCDPDCDNGIDPDCPTCSNAEGDCCNNDNDGVCDPDCITGVDPDCKCGNGIIDPGETCDSANLDSKTCNNFFPGYGGLLACFDADGEHACHFDTSGCHKIPDVCTGGFCGFGKDCRCPECVGQQNGCNYGAVCDATARCACIDGTTLCKDGTCRTPQNCDEFDGGEQKCIGTPNNICDPGEGCGCQDCEDKEGPCNHLSICKNGVCTGCFLKRAYWADINTGEEENCIGSGNDIKMIVEGTPGCKEKSINFEIGGIPQGSAVFKNSKAEFVWPKEKVIIKSEDIVEGRDKSYYKFKASLKGGDSKNEMISKDLEVEYCITECDADCDNYCEKNTQTCKEAAIPGKPAGSYCVKLEGTELLEERSVKLDANAMKSAWCIECDPEGLAKGQTTCAAYYDCTPGWWIKEGKQYSDFWTVDPSSLLEWGDCGDDKGATGAERQHGDNMRNRLVCSPELSRNECCADADQASCYCKLPDFNNPKIKKFNCDLPQFRPTEIKGCMAEEKFPFFTNMNILIVVLILTGFYIWKTRKD